MKHKSQLSFLIFSGVFLIQLPAQSIAWPSNISNLFSAMPNVVKSVAIQAPLAYLAVQGATLAHEGGHALATLAAKISLHKTVINKESLPQQKQSARKFTFGFWPQRHSHIQRENTGNNIKNALISAAGPVAGLLFSYAALKASTLIENNQLLQLAAYYTAFENIKNLLPDEDIEEPNDGTNICDALKVPAKIVNPLRWLGHSFCGQVLLSGALATMFLHSTN